jgi:hypothetical protein
MLATEPVSKAEQVRARLARAAHELRAANREARDWTGRPVGVVVEITEAEMAVQIPLGRLVMDATRAPKPSND